MGRIEHWVKSSWASTASDQLVHSTKEEIWTGRDDALEPLDSTDACLALLPDALTLDDTPLLLSGRLLGPTDSDEDTEIAS